ncbi:MAG: hypothetical protein NZ693_08800 [Thermoflexales bacterium]|nr:hypothetical protein [Thermoflexales bacterium]
MGARRAPTVARVNGRVEAHGVRPVIPERERARRPYLVVPLCAADFLPLH